MNWHPNHPLRFRQLLDSCGPVRSLSKYRHLVMRAGMEGDSISTNHRKKTYEKAHNWSVVLSIQCGIRNAESCLKKLMLTSTDLVSLIVF